MPNGNFHRTLTKTLLITNVPLYFFIEPVTCTGILIGIVISLWVNPDNDLAVNRLGVYKYLGFNHYQQFISHRSGLRWSSWKNLAWKDCWKLLFFSHCPITGTLLRFILILYAPILLLILISTLQLWMAWLILGVFIGLCESDLVHEMADLIWSGLKKAFPFLRRYDTTKAQRDNGFRPFTQSKNRATYRQGGR